MAPRTSTPASERPSTAHALNRHFPVGAEVLADGSVHFRVWAPNSSAVGVELELPDGAKHFVPLEAEGGSYFSVRCEKAHVGMRYRIRLDHGVFPDPVSRFQPDGPHGPSQIVDARAFRWTDQTWRGRTLAELVFYEMHIGTFTPEGTWRAAMEQLPELQRLGVTALEVMPIADFTGTFGWGYDGVDLFAPTRLYGDPDDARAFVDRAHALGLMVILDVVYNHFGPDGSYLTQFAADYVSRERKSEWGDTLNFDGPNSGPVRELILTNARYWIEEFHFDGLRLDATQQMFDDSSTSIIAEIAAAARASGCGRTIVVVGENEPQQTSLARAPGEGGFGLDALWNDDFHHAALVAVTGRTEAYYSDYRGTPQELISALKYGFLFQGQWCQWQRRRRGATTAGLDRQQFVTFLQNHDQVANSLRGERLHQLASPGHVRAITALWLLGPQTPLLFQGQEFGASSPFLYFADHPAELRTAVSRGRREFLEQFQSVACAESHQVLREPGDRETFVRCRLDFSERETHRPLYQLHQDLLRIRRESSVFTRPARLDGAVLGEQLFVLRFFERHGDDRLVLVNLGRDTRLREVAEPLLAPVAETNWQLAWSSENPAYGGRGTPPVETRDGWVIPGQATLVLRPAAPAELPSARLHENDRV